MVKVQLARPKLETAVREGLGALGVAPWPTEMPRTPPSGTPPGDGCTSPAAQGPLTPSPANFQEEDLCTTRCDSF